MKSINLLLAFLFISSFLIAQDCVNNPSVQAGDINPAPLTPGVIGDASFTYFENLTDHEDWQAAPVKMTVCLLNIVPMR